MAPPRLRADDQFRREDATRDHPQQRAELLTGGEGVSSRPVRRIVLIRRTPEPLPMPGETGVEPFAAFSPWFLRIRCGIGF